MMRQIDRSNGYTFLCKGKLINLSLDSLLRNPSKLSTELIGRQNAGNAHPLQLDYIPRLIEPIVDEMTDRSSVNWAEYNTHDLRTIFQYTRELDLNEISNRVLEVILIKHKRMAQAARQGRCGEFVAIELRNLDRFVSHHRIRQSKPKMDDHEIQERWNAAAASGHRLPLPEFDDDEGEGEGDDDSDIEEAKGERKERKSDYIARSNVSTALPALSASSIPSFTFAPIDKDAVNAVNKVDRDVVKGDAIIKDDADVPPIVAAKRLSVDPSLPFTSE